MNRILDIPEVRALDGCTGLLRIPPNLDIPLTDRVRAIIDSAPFRRLAEISQLGLVSRVYPAANHTRFEHSLGVYRLALLFLKQLSQFSDFVSTISTKDAELLIVSALLHDIGHWPYCHPIEDMHLAGLPSHESFARRYVMDGPISRVVREDWKLDPAQIIALLEGRSDTPASTILESILSGPIDVDKMDYLMRDSLHAGVPYGRNFDQSRLISSLCLNEQRDGLAITEKGRTAAEMMVFARYVMFSEVYWHHAVRSATAMLQRAVFENKDQCNYDSLFEMTEYHFVRTLRAASATAIVPLLDGLFGTTRALYKRAAQVSYVDDPDTYNLLARRGYDWLVDCSRQLADSLSSTAGCNIPAEHVLIDAPPTKLEVQFDLDVFYPKANRFRTLGDVSPVVRTLAETQFDRIVKRVRIFVHPESRPKLPESHEVIRILNDIAS